jgi:opacity protein-like surface antigen
MKNALIACSILFLVFSSQLIAQTNFAFSFKGGANYTPMRGIEHAVISWDKSQIDRFNYSAIAGFKYSFNEKHSAVVDFEYQPVSLSYFSSGWLIQYRLKFYAITLSYDYKFSIDSELDFYLGAGAGYILLNSGIYSFSDIPFRNPDWFKDEGLLLNTKFGTEYYLSELLSLSAEIQYRYVETLKRNKYNNLNEVNISGISLLIGFNINI